MTRLNIGLSIRGLTATAVALAVAACASAPRGGGYYLDDGPGDRPPHDLALLADARPHLEPLHRSANNPYVAFGKEYVPERNLRPLRQRGIASWYGQRFHGNPTASGEIYDMYAMTAAHPTLPIPSYARVTHVGSGRSVVVRINDRGPFLHDRIIDLSYAAALRLGYLDEGSALVDVEAIVPGGAEPSAAVPNEASQSASADAPSGIYVQIGAFSVRENAESLRARLALELATLDRAIEISLKDGLFRLQVGPYRSRAEAHAIAEIIRGAFDVQPHLIVR